MNLQTITPDLLVPGAEFKTSIKQRKFRTFKKCFVLNNEGHKGMLLIIHSGCEQMILDPTQEVFVKQDYMKPVLTIQSGPNEYTDWLLLDTEKIHACRRREWENEFEERRDQEGLMSVFSPKDDKGYFTIGIYQWR